MQRISSKVNKFITSVSKLISQYHLLKRALIYFISNLSNNILKYNVRFIRMQFQRLELKAVIQTINL